MSEENNLNEARKAYIKTVCAPHGKVEEAVAVLKNICPQIEVKISCRYGDLTMEIEKNSVEAKDFDRAYREAVTILNDHVYALENVPLADRLVQLLKLRKIMISVAESFTGGGVGKRIVEIPGASEVFFEGLNTYSNLSKMRRLGVEEAVLERYGAVSKECAFQMAEGLLNSGTCSVSVATTGIAGPKSDNTNKPVGLIYIAVGYEENIMVYKYNLDGSRQEITETAINLALFLAFKSLK